jgi:hypothetical protein
MNLCSTIFALNNEYYILSYFDADEALSEEFLREGLQNVLAQYPMLKKTFITQNNTIQLYDIPHFDIDHCFFIKYIKNFNAYTKKIMNRPFTEYKFNVIACINKESNKSRVYVKIHHAYADGYKIIEMFNLFLSNNTSTILPEFKRKTENNIFYSIFGTIMLIFMNILICIKILIQYFIPTPNNKDKPSDYIICKSFRLDKIKKFTIKNKITVNDFLYALMIKTDQLYTNKKRLIQTMSPINVYKLNEMNNMLPIYNIIDNSSNTSSLLKNINTAFNNYKYSLYMSLLSGYTTAITYLHQHYVPFSNDLLQTFFDAIMNSSDYIYTNIIGPKITNVELKNIHFLINPINNEIIYNIVSFENNVNIICSFKEGIIQDKKLFKQCIYKAYKEITTYI